MKFTHSRLVAALLAVLFLPACTRDGRNTDPLSRDASEQEALPAEAVSMPSLSSFRLDLLREAFRNLGGYTFTRIVQTEQLNESGEVVAAEQRAVRYQMRDGQWAVTVEPVASSGAFHFGFFGRFVSRGEPISDVESLADALVPEDPPYFSPRNRDAFIYTTAPDTVLNGRRVATLVITAAPGAEEFPTKYARLYYDPRTYEVLALYLEHASPALLFRENTTFYVQVKPGIDGRWLPDTTSVSTRIRLPLTAPRRFRTTSRFINYTPVVR